MINICYLLVFFSLLVFTTTIPSFAIFSIIVFFLLCSLFLYMLGFSFLALIILIVYVGAVAILFIFCTILFERNTPLRAYFFYRRLLIYSFLGFFLYVLVNFISPLFFYPFSTQFQFDVWYSANDEARQLIFENLDFIDVFASFFFTSDLGLIYTTLVGFFLFFFTIAVTYIFYFTKKLLT
jgi:NADH:ubiquinone oxidoreductase subunit 6 (subunit J)